jgi:Zn-dependent protease/CBS domain-containing protein
VLRGNFKIGRLFGIPIEINVTWILVLVLVMWTVADGYFGQERFKYLTALQRWLLGAAAAFLFFGSILLHELMHSVVAVRNGLPVRRITLFMFGGVAEMSREPEKASVEFKMALAGPIASFMLSAVFLAVFYGIYRSGGGAMPLLGALAIYLSGGKEAVSVPAALFAYLAMINSLILIFNMVPGFPLDGGRVLRSIIWYFTGNVTRATYITSRIGKAFAIVLIVLGLLFAIQGELIAGIWFIFIGFFLQQAAESGYYQVLMRKGLEGHHVYDVMQPAVVTVDADTPVRTAVQDYFMRFRFNSFPVLDNGQLVGMLTTHDLKAVPREEWDLRMVREIMETEPVEHALSLDESAYGALVKIAQDGMGRLPVLQNGVVVGIVSNRDIMKLLKLKMDIG